MRAGPRAGYLNLPPRPANGRKLADSRSQSGLRTDQLSRRPANPSASLKPVPPPAEDLSDDHVWQSSMAKQTTLGCLLVISLGAAAAACTSAEIASPARASLTAPGHAAELPEGAELRVALGHEGGLGLLVLTADQRIWAQLSLRPLENRPMPGVHVEFREDERVISANAEQISGGLVGDIDIGDGYGSWRVATDRDGSLSGRRWSPALARHCPSLHLAREIASDLHEIVPELGAQAGLSEPDARALLEDVLLAQLALDLGLRSCEGRGRAALPNIGEPITGPFAWR